MSEALNISSSPHVRDRWTTPYIMRVVLLSLMPATCVGIISYGWQARAGCDFSRTDRMGIQQDRP